MMESGRPTGPMTDRAIRTPADLDGLAFWENGLLPVVAQCVDSGQVLMVAFANREALEKTLSTGQVHYWSRSRGELWHKGATSGNFQDLVSLHADCDADTLLARVRPRGPACHTGEETCFGALKDPDDLDESSRLKDPEAGGAPSTARRDPSPEITIPELWATLLERDRLRPSGSYTVKLLENENLRLKKLGEETAELVAALAKGETGRAVSEGADLFYHLLAALLAEGVTFQDLLTELEKRKG